MHPLLRARVWFAATVLLAALGLFVLGGTAGGVVLAVAMGAFLFACFRALSGERVDDRAAGTGLFGGWF